MGEGTATKPDEVRVTFYITYVPPMLLTYQCRTKCKRVLPPR